MIKRLLTSLCAIPVVMSLSLSSVDALGVSKDAKQRSVDICKTYKGKYDPSLGMTVAEWNVTKAKLMPFCDGTTFHCTTHRKGGIFGMVKGVCDSPDLCKDPVIQQACKQQCVDNRRQDQKSEAIKQKLETCPVKPIRPSSDTPQILRAPQQNVAPATPAVEAEPFVGRGRSNTFGSLTPLPKADAPVNSKRHSLPVNPAELSDSEMRMMQDAAMEKAQEEAMREEAMRKAEMDRKMAEEMEMREEMMRYEEEMKKAQEAADLSIPSAPLPAAQAPESIPAPSFLDDSIPLPPVPPAVPSAPPAPPFVKKNPLASSATIERAPAANRDELRSSAPAASDRDGLLAAIRQGQALKSVSPEEKALLEQQKKETLQDNSNPVLGTLQKAMEARRGAIYQDDEEPDDVDGDDWD